VRYAGFSLSYAQMAKDLYSVLGLQKGASAEDIKKAYRKMSKEWHPDKHKGDKGAEDKFKEINEAYEVLSNEEKKRMYDQFGTTGGPGGAQGFGGFDFSQFNNGNMGDIGDIFGSFFGEAMGGGRRARNQNKGADREIELTIELKDVLSGIQYPLELKMLISCDTCSGSGAEPGSQIVTCDTCGGTGQVTRVAQSFFGAIQQRGVCQICGGSGKVPKESCHTCKGEGRLQGKREVTVDIPAGVNDGQTLRFRGYGDAGRRGEAAGDLYVHVRVAQSDDFERDGDDIRSTVAIPVLTAILGGSIDVPTLHGTSTVQIPEGTQPGTVMRLKGKGVPELGSSRHGDHYVTVQVEIPKRISRSERKILEEWKQARGD